MHNRNYRNSGKVITVIDVLSALTGTGDALVLDGQDAGTVSASIVDTQGRVIPSASNNTNFSIVSVIGVENGDLFCHEPNKASWRSAYHGLAHFAVQVTEKLCYLLFTREMMVETN